MSESAPRVRPPGEADASPQGTNPLPARAGRSRSSEQQTRDALAAEVAANGAPGPRIRAPTDSALRTYTEHDLPHSDGEPMPDSGEQARAIGGTFYGLCSRYLHRRDVTIEEDMFMYYEAEDERGPLPVRDGHRLKDGRQAPRVAPDVLVAFGVPARRERLSYVIWREGKVPDFILEVASSGTWQNDYGWKRELYERLGVQEYFIFDSRLAPGRPRLTAFRLKGGKYEELGPAMHEGVGTGIRSDLLGLIAHADGRDLRWWNPLLKEDMRYPTESESERLREREGRLREREGRLREREGRLRERRKREELERRADELAAKVAALQAEIDPR